MIYFIRRADNRRIKIGMSVNLRRRLADLRRETGQSLEVMGFVKGEASRERALHLKFAHLRAVGEWFEPSPDLLAYIGRYARAWAGQIDRHSLTVVLPGDDSRRLERCAHERLLPVPAYIRQAVMERIRADESRG